MDTITPLMTPKQVAGVLQLSLSSISRMCASGQLEAVRPFGQGRGKPVRITAESVRKAMTPTVTTQVTEQTGEAGEAPVHREPQPLTDTRQNPPTGAVSPAVPGRSAVLAHPQDVGNPRAVRG